MEHDDDEGFWTKEQVCDLTTLSEAELVRATGRGEFPELYAVGSNPNNPQSRAAYKRGAVRAWLRSRPLKPRRASPQDDSLNGS